jgi:hypothetical protein
MRKMYVKFAILLPATCYLAMLRPINQCAKINGLPFEDFSTFPVFG